MVKGCEIWRGVGSLESLDLEISAQRVPVRDAPSAGTALPLHGISLSTPDGPPLSSSGFLALGRGSANHELVVKVPENNRELGGAAGDGGGCGGMGLG